MVRGAGESRLSRSGLSRELRWDVSGTVVVRYRLSSSVEAAARPG